MHTPEEIAQQVRIIRVAFAERVTTLDMLRELGEAVQRHFESLTGIAGRAPCVHGYYAPKTGAFLAADSVSPAWVPVMEACGIVIDSLEEVSGRPEWNVHVAEFNAQRRSEA